MEKIIWPIMVVTTFAFFYQLTPYMGFSDDAILSMFCFSPFPVLWLAYHLLKNGTASTRTFDEYFYDDIDYKRNEVKGHSL
jgi:hypothetical protein